MVIAFTVLHPIYCSEVDSDGDDVPDHCDQCFLGQDDRVDSDGDEVPDCLDECPSNPFKTEATMCGCSYWESDPDSDGECGWSRPGDFTLRTRNNNNNDEDAVPPPPAPRPHA